MRLTDTQIQRLAQRLVTDLVERRQTDLKKPRDRIEGVIREVFRANLAAEQELEREARNMVEVHSRQAPPDLDRRKLFQMIKKRLAEDKGFPL